MPIKRILQLDGGGILGITPAIVLARLEADLMQSGKVASRLGEILDLVTGTSTGSIIAGMVAAGVPAAKICDYYQSIGPKVFAQSKHPFLTLDGMVGPLYDRKPFIATFSSVLGSDSIARSPTLTLGGLPVKFMAATYNLCSQRTHFIKSYDPTDAGRSLVDVISWSGLSAAHYFGAIHVEDYDWEFLSADPDAEYVTQHGAVFQDGGQGTQNCTLGFCLTEIMAKTISAVGDEVHIISLGCGNTTPKLAYESMTRADTLDQTWKYLKNEARPEATPVQIMAARYVAAHNPLIKVFRLDYEAAADHALDDIAPASIATYVAGARKILDSETYKLLAASF
jgi:hypothetical protein